MKKIELAVNQRQEVGKGPARRLRASGKIPAVFYGKKSQPIKLSVDLYAFQKSYEHAGRNPLFALKIGDEQSAATRSAIVKERQVNPVDGSLIHLDFLEVSMDQPIEVTVPVEFKGKPVGVEKGGVLQTFARALQVTCLPGRIPEVIEVDISQLDIHNSVHVGDVTLAEGVSVTQDVSVILAIVVPPKRGGEALEGAEAPAEGAEAPGESEAASK